MFISVVLPAPFSPSSAWISPGRTSRSMPSLATTPGYRFTIPRISRARGGAFSVTSQAPNLSRSVGISAGAGVCDARPGVVLPSVSWGPSSLVRVEEALAQALARIQASLQGLERGVDLGLDLRGDHR